MGGRLMDGNIQRYYTWERGDGFHNTIQEAVTFWKNKRQWRGQAIPAEIAFADYDTVKQTSVNTGKVPVPEHHRQ